MRSADPLRAKVARELDDPAGSYFEPPTVPDHKLLYRIGIGSYGDVWLAQNALGTARAVKIVYRARFKDDRPYEREFEGILKYEPISRTHDGLVQVLHVGRSESSNCFYYVMELADDSRPLEAGSAVPSDDYRPRTLTCEVSRPARFPAVDAARLALKLTNAVGHLHKHGLVHRDIKPSNVIFVRGEPKLADIGLVTDLGSSRSFVGTEGFIPPEGPGSCQADLYGLGKLLYELATGRDRMDFPQLPPRVERLPDGEALLELNEVITRACAPAVQERYSSASEMEADLNSFLAGRSLRKERNIERRVAQLRKVVVVAAVLLAVVGTALWFSKREERYALTTARAALDRAEHEARSRETEAGLRRRAEAAEERTEQQLYTALLEQSRALVRSGKIGQRFQALDAIRRAAAITNKTELRREAVAALALPDLRLADEIAFGEEFTLQWCDPKLERIAVCRRGGPVEIRSLPGNEIIATLPASTNLITWGATWSNDGRFLAVKRDYPGGDRALLEVWEVEKAKRVLLIDDVRYNTRAFHPTKALLLVACGINTIAQWDLESGKEIARQSFEVTSENLTYSPDGNFVAASYGTVQGPSVSVHDALTGSMICSRVFTNWVSCVVWHPDGKRLAVTDHGGQVNLMDARTGITTFVGAHKAEVAMVTFSPGGEFLITGGWERELICWDLVAMQRVLTIARNSYIVQLSADGRRCVLINPKSVEIHDFATPSHRALGPQMGSRLSNAAFSSDGQWLAGAGDKWIGVWDLKNGRAGPGTKIGTKTTASVQWAPGKNEIMASSHADGVLHWDVQRETGWVEPKLVEKSASVLPGFLSLALSSDLVFCITVKGTRRTSLDDGLHQEKWVPTLPGNGRVSPDGRWLGIYKSYGNVLHIYELPELHAVAQLTNSGSIGGFSFSVARDEVAIGTRHQMEFWSTKTWERKRTFADFIGVPLVGALYEPNGRLVWLTKNYNTAGLYDAETLEPVLALPDGILPLAIDRQGKQLAIGVDGQRVQVWDLPVIRSELRSLGLDWNEDRSALPLNSRSPKTSEVQ